MRTLIILQDTDIEPLQIEELILAKSQLKTIDDEFQAMNLETPDWVITRLSDTLHEITKRVKNELQRRLRTATARRDALKTNAEKRKDLDAEIAALEKQLG